MSEGVVVCPECSSAALMLAVSTGGGRVVQYKMLRNLDLQLDFDVGAQATVRQRIVCAACDLELAIPHHVAVGGSRPQAWR